MRGLSRIPSRTAGPAASAAAAAQASSSPDPVLLPPSDPVPGTTGAGLLQAPTEGHKAEALPARAEMSSSSDSEDFYQQRAARVEVLMNTPPMAVTEAQASTDGVGSSAAAPTTSSVAADGASLAEKAIAALPPNLQEMAKDPKRKAKSSDPRWKYGFMPDPLKKETIQCIFCNKKVHSRIKRFKQHD
ncbi:hypothetical protein BS78_01G250600 [Paspalum vaginatum]|nr:hypothetical protein BS78_01G250600 [Paspalum vaginatum]